MTEKQLDNLKVGDVLYTYQWSMCGTTPMKEIKVKIIKISPNRKSFTIESDIPHFYDNKINERQIRSCSLEPKEEIRKRMIKNKENIKHRENLFKEFSLLELNDFNNVYDIKAEDFKDNVERLKYTTDMKIRLCEEFEGIILGKCGCLLIEKLEVISETGTIYDNGELNLEQKLYHNATKQDYIEFEQKVRKHFEFNFAKEFDKLPNRYEWFRIDKENEVTSTVISDKINGRFWRDGKISLGLSTVIGEGNIDTKERFNKLIELLDFVDKQYKERQEFLTTIK